MAIWNIRKKKGDLSEQESLASSAKAQPESLAAFETPAPYNVKDTSITASGLYPHEVLLIDSAVGFFIDQEEFPPLWQREYGILQMTKLLASLVERGFLTDAPMQSTLESATVTTLKHALKEAGRPVGGKKAELIQRLLHTVPEGQLYELFPRRTFAPTQSGIRALDESMHISYLHRHPVEELTIWVLHRLVVENPEKSYRDLVWSHLESRAHAHIKAEDYAAYRACRYRMYQFHMEENKRKRAFPFLAEVIYYDLSGAGGGADTLQRYISEKYFFPYDRSIVKLPGVCVSAMGKLRDELGLTEEMLKALLMQFFGQLSVPFHLFTVEECAVIVLLELRGDAEKLRKVYQLAEKRFTQRK